jgi:hypothetical protein
MIVEHDAGRSRVVGEHDGGVAAGQLRRHPQAASRQPRGSSVGGGSVADAGPVGGCVGMEVEQDEHRRLAAAVRGWRGRGGRADDAAGPARRAERGNLAIRGVGQPARERPDRR